ncbi:hypothetical protein CRG98_019424 [Punica granatum]|uniref:Uncharacterized protein n=1 Tax=Punica granatum TaxID=22663 RepID=A0A2I0JXP9_PUNGR|nr:hypothetical protein CRG98_019424 [Punica granatum]
MCFCYGQLASLSRTLLDIGITATNQQPRPFHRGLQQPQRTPATSVEGSRSSIGDPNPKSTGDRQLRVPVRFEVGASNRRPRPLHRDCRCPLGYWRPRWRDRSRRLATSTPNQLGTLSWGRQSMTLTPPPRLPASSVGTDDLGGGVRVVDWRPRPLIPFRFSL